MPVYDLTYRRAPTLPRRESAFAPVLAQTLRFAFRTRALKVLFALAWIPFLFMASILYLQAGVAGRFPSGLRALAGDLRWYLGLFSFEQIWLAIFTIGAGTGLVAEDRRANAFELYFARPLTRREYVLGKWTGLASVLFLVTGAPALALWGFDILIAEDTSRLVETLDYPWRLAAFGVVLAGGTAVFTLAISALSRSGRQAALVVVVVWFLSNALAGILQALTGSRGAAAVGFVPNFMAIGNWIFDLTPPPHARIPPARSALVVFAALVVVSFAVLYRRVRPTEVVK